ncbi:hypothetical protein C8Q75DRAFT_773556, partial [Abortiporus biennis]
MKRSFIITLSIIAPAFAGKRGLGWPADNPFNPSIFSSPQVTFLFNWGPVNTPQNTEFPFWAMQWGSGGIDELEGDVTSGHPSVIMGFNEPDNESQSNLSPVDAANLWKENIQPLAGTGAKLISPAITNGGAPSGTAWLSSFLEECSGCQIDGVAAHWYGGWTDDFEAFIESLKEFNKPIYLTEFGFSWDEFATTDSFMQFLPLALDYLDNEPAVEAYAFFGAFHSGTAKDMINADGTLTDIGKLYVSS